MKSSSIEDIIESITLFIDDFTAGLKSAAFIPSKSSLEFIIVLVFSTNFVLKLLDAFLSNFMLENWAVKKALI